MSQTQEVIIESWADKVKGIAKNVGHSLITWEWTKRLLHWLIISAGTMSECAFLIASLWMSLNSSVHPFVLLFLSEQQTVHISDLATAAYVGLPECILGLAFVTTISHFRTLRYTKDNAAGVWFGLYLLPTLVFLILSLVTLGFSVANQHFIMPVPGVVARALAGYMFAFVSLLYTQLGAPQEKDRLQEKDDLIAQIKEMHAKFVAQLRHEKDGIIAKLRQEKDDIVQQFTFENTNKLAALGSDKDRLISQIRFESQGLQQQIENQKREIARLNELFETVKNEKQQLFDALNQSNEDALQAYSSDCLEWLNSNIKSATIDEIIRFTGHQKRKIEGAINRGNLKTATHSKETRVMIASLIPWLKQNLPTDKEPSLRIVNE